MLTRYVFWCLCSFVANTERSNRPGVAIIATARLKLRLVSQSSFNTWASSVLDLGALQSGVSPRALLRVAAIDAHRAPPAYLMPMANCRRDELPTPRLRVILATRR